jgi:predicted outer membrane protein
MRNPSRVIRLTSFAALGLAGLVAYGSSNATAASPAAAASPPSGLKGVPSEPKPLAAALSECSVGGVLGVAHAFIHSWIEASKLAVDRAQNPEVKEYAQRTLEDSQRLDQDLSQWESHVGAQPVETEISKEVSRGAHAVRERLERSQDFDREYVAHEIMGGMKAVGFLHLVMAAVHEGTGSGEEQGQTQGSSGAKLNEGARLVEDAKRTVGSRLKEAFRLEKELVGACGEPSGESGAQPEPAKTPARH